MQQCQQQRTKEMLAVMIPRPSCRVGSRSKNATDTTIVTSIAIEVAYTCKAQCAPEPRAALAAGHSACAGCLQGYSPHDSILTAPSAHSRSVSQVPRTQPHTGVCHALAAPDIQWCTLQAARRGTLQSQKGTRLHDGVRELHDPGDHQAGERQVGDHGVGEGGVAAREREGR